MIDKLLALSALGSQLCLLGVLLFLIYQQHFPSSRGERLNAKLFAVEWRDPR